MQLHTFYEERGFLEFLQTHANATMRVLYVEPTGKKYPIVPARRRPDRLRRRYSGGGIP